MPPRRQAQQTAYEQLERRLLLNGWLLDQFGYVTNSVALDDLKDADEGVDAEGRSYVFHRLIGRGTRLRMAPAHLAIYDENVTRHLGLINASRHEKIELRYFQRIALLFAERYLHLLNRRREFLLTSLNLYVAEHNSRRVPGDLVEYPFVNEDLSRLAFWMATGSGKTLLLHINYLQFLHYRTEPLDNVLLITPNEGLSDQHLDEMAISGLPAERFRLDDSGLGFRVPNTVRVIEITKLVEEKRGGGVTVPVEHFEGSNLIFVDEGHKGSGGETWRRYRDALATTGFTFEYSATFAQALSAARNDELTRSYGKWIAFDYSYRYFHGDGFGKDFRIVNVQRESTEANTRLLLVGNLLTFFEQVAVYQSELDALKRYNLAPPLWTFVGSSVNAVYTSGGREHSDVLTVLRFIHAFLRNRNQWALRSIEKLFEGRSGLTDSVGQDIFHDRLDFLRSRYSAAEDLYRDALSAIFHASEPGGLVIRDLRGQSGELGLRVATGAYDFGVVYIGDTAKFKRLVEADDSGLVSEEDVVSDSLFGQISDVDSRINVLVGAKKFMEGWNSWRVTSMSLLNIGRSEGSEVIQLFGRGVRLLGLGRSLKRSAAIDGSHPPYIGSLETLNIFGVRANYMAQFREYLEREGVDPDGRVALPLRIRTNQNFMDKGLLVPRVSGAQNFIDQETVLLLPDPGISVTVDLSPCIEALQSGSTATERVRTGVQQGLPAKVLSAIDWDQLHEDLLTFKASKGFSNLVIVPEVSRQLLTHDPPLYRLIAEPGLVDVSTFEDARRLQNVAGVILRKYVTKYFRVEQERWETLNMVYREVDLTDQNLRDDEIRIARREAALISAVERLIAEGNRIYRAETIELPNVHLDEHLYQPLLVQRSPKVRSDPPGLGESELQFVQDLRDYLRAEATASLSGKEIFVLRNLTRGKGVGFFENEGFYPDFIIWVREEDRQRVVFVEPHGMLHEKAYWTSDKAQLHKRLRQLSDAWRDRSPGPKVELDAFIISKTPYLQLRDYYATGTWSIVDFAQHHVLFFESPGYVARLFDDAAAEYPV